jgi:two-component system chemotaxis sensor kinase CheA
VEETKRQEEMRSLFEVMQVEPKVFGDFVEDIEFEFDRINDTLREGNLSNIDMMVEMYQSAHAIKSNAVILGLKNFSGKVHDLESQIKEFRERETISFEDMLHISVELERLMKEKDKFRETVERIRSFGSGEEVKGDVEVFTETLTKAAGRVSQDTDKKVRLEMIRLDPQALAGEKRRLIKDALTQLVRNAVYHGIESPEERQKRGKDEYGRIQVSIVMEEGQVRITLEDDGQGLDFEKIAAKAREQGLLKKPEDAENMQFLSGLIFMPAFSTSKIENVHAGRGVGLNLVRDRVREARGKISLRSAQGKGTRFEIVIPA